MNNSPRVSHFKIQMVHSFFYALTNKKPPKKKGASCILEYAEDNSAVKTVADGKV